MRSLPSSLDTIPNFLSVVLVIISILVVIIYSRRCPYSCRIQKLNFPQPASPLPALLRSCSPQLGHDGQRENIRSYVSPSVEFLKELGKAKRSPLYSLPVDCLRLGRIGVY